jgi:hypothetical protein
MAMEQRVTVDDHHRDCRRSAAVEGLSQAAVSRQPLLQLGPETVCESDRFQDVDATS